jgi:hypothetical protein
MDTNRDITYRGFLLNDEDIQDSIVGGGFIGSGVAGCVVDSVDFSDVDVVQYLEKRSQADGSDAGDVMFGVRRIRMAGTLYHKTRGLLFDSLFTLRAALNPVLAQREEPLDKGYRPLYFSVPTNRIDEYEDGFIPLQIFALPRSFQQLTNRDMMGGADSNSLAVSWQATLICKDPGIYAVDPVDVAFDATASVTGTTGAAATNLFTKVAHGLVAGDRITFSAKTGGTGLNTGVAYYIISSGLTADAFRISTTSGGAELDLTTDLSASTWVKSSTASGSWTNRGLYLGTFNAVIEVGAGAGTIVATVGDSAFTVTVPASVGNRIIRIKGTDKMLTFEEDDIELPVMSNIAFDSDTTYPLIDPGDTPYSITFHGMSGIVAGSHMWFYEQYA